MNTRQKLHQLHLNEWISRFTNQKSSGLTVKQWCEQNNYSIHTYNYWKHILKEELTNQVLPDLVPLMVPDTTLLPDTVSPLTSTQTSSLTNRAIRATPITATLSFNDITIQVDSSISEDFLRTIIKAVRHA